MSRSAHTRPLAFDRLDRPADARGPRVFLIVDGTDVRSVVLSENGREPSLRDRERLRAVSSLDALNDSRLDFSGASYVITGNGSNAVSLRDLWMPRAARALRGAA